MFGLVIGAPQGRKFTHSSQAQETRDRESQKQVLYLEDDCSFSCHFVAAMFIPANYVSGPKVTCDSGVRSTPVSDKQENMS